MGYIQTSNDGTRYIIKSPLETNYNYLATLDQNNNNFISGNSIIIGNVSIGSSLNINNNCVFN